jgi:hypothetical protein
MDRTMTTNEEIDMAAAVLLDALKVGATLYPPLALAMPIISAAITYGFANLKAGLADGSILAVDGGRGGFVSKAWAADPREQLNPDGTFKF